MSYVFFRLAQSVKMMIAVAIFLTYSLQFYVPMEIMWKSLKHRFTSRPLLAEYIMRILFVIGTGENLFPFILPSYLETLRN
jgi:hypothetical protein